MSLFAGAFCPVGIITDPDQAVTAVARIHQPVGASSQNSLGLFCLPLTARLLKINVAVLFVGQGAVLPLAVGALVPEREKPLQRGSLPDVSIFSVSGSGFRSADGVVVIVVVGVAVNWVTLVIVVLFFQIYALLHGRFVGLRSAGSSVVVVWG